MLGALGGEGDEPKMGNRECYIAIDQGEMTTAFWVKRADMNGTFRHGWGWKVRKAANLLLTSLPPAIRPKRQLGSQ